MMTLKNFYSTIVATTSDEEIKATAQHLLDKVNADALKKAKASATKRAESTLPKIVAIESYLCSIGNEPSLLADVAKATGFTIQSVSGIATTMEKEGRLAKYDAKVKGKGTMRAIALTAERFAELTPSDESDGEDTAEIPTEE